MYYTMIWTHLLWTMSMPKNAEIRLTTPIIMRMNIQRPQSCTLYPNLKSAPQRVISHTPEYLHITKLTLT